MPQRTLSSRFRLNALSHGYGQIVTLAVQLLLVPFFLSHWGTDRYADWLVLTGIPMMLTLLDLGVSQALASKATTQAAAKQYQEARTSLQTALAFTLALCSAILVLTVIANPLINWSTLLNLRTLSGEEASVIVILMAAYLCAGLMCGPLDAWFRTIDRASSGAFLMANRRMLDVVISISVLSCNGSAITLAALLLAGQIIATMLLYLQAIRWSTWPVFGLTYASWRVFQQTLKPALAYMGFPVAQVISLQGGLQVLNQFASPATVVAFLMGRTLMRFVIQAGVVANNALKPEISRMTGLGQFQQAEKFSIRTSKFIFLYAIAAYISLALLGPIIFELWSHGKVTATRLDLALIGFHAVINVAWFIPAALLIATNRHSRLSVIYGISSTASLAGWAMFAHQIPQIFGASIALMIPEIFALVYLKMHQRRANSKIGEEQ